MVDVALITEIMAAGSYTLLKPQSDIEYKEHLAALSVEVGPVPVDFEKFLEKGAVIYFIWEYTLQGFSFWDSVHYKGINSPNYERAMYIISAWESLYAVSKKCNSTHNTESLQKMPVKERVPHVLQKYVKEKA